MGTMNTNLKRKLIDDLKKSGFASEMEAISLASTDVWDVIPSYSYTDIQEGKPRTVDFVGWKNCSYPPQYVFHNGLEFFLVCEVKKSERPWVVFVETGIHEQNDDDPIVSGRNFPSEGFCGLSPQDPLFVLKEVQGYAIHESFKPPSETSRWFGAFISTIKASEAINRFEHEARDSELSGFANSYKLFHFHLRYIQPVVILDGDLFFTRLNSENIEIFEVDMLPVRIKYDSKGFDRLNYKVHVVTLKNLSLYLDIINRFHCELLDKYFEKAKLDKRKLFKNFKAYERRQQSKLRKQ